MSKNVAMLYTLTGMLFVIATLAWYAEKRGLDAWMESPRAIFGRMQRERLIEEEGQPQEEPNTEHADGTE